MMEGDLLEVSLDETQHIWRILKHTYSHNNMRTYGSFEEAEANQDVKDAKKRGRKRKLEDSELLKKIRGQKIERQRKIEEKVAVKRKMPGPVVKEKKQSSSPIPVKRDSATVLKRGPRKVFHRFLHI